MATISRLLKIIRSFRKRALLKRPYSAKETYNLKEPTDRSHPIPVYPPISEHLYNCVHFYQDISLHWYQCIYTLAGELQKRRNQKNQHRVRVDETRISSTSGHLRTSVHLCTLSSAHGHLRVYTYAHVYIIYNRTLYVHLYTYAQVSCTGGHVCTCVHFYICCHININWRVESYSSEKYTHVYVQYTFISICVYMYICKYVYIYIAPSFLAQAQTTPSFLAQAQTTTFLILNPSFKPVPSISTGLKAETQV